MTADEIRELIRMAAEEGVLELEVQRGENRVRIRLDVAAAPGTVIAPPPPTADSAAPAATFAPPEKSEGATDPNLVLVKSPIVGTFYESPAPGAPPFVRVGERIQPGKVLCIIESMKLMNEIEAETAGILESKLVQNGQPIEYGEALFAIRAV